MIENEIFTRTPVNKLIMDAANKRELKISRCGNSMVLYNDFYGFFFLDLINEGRLDAWVVDRKKIKQTQTMTDLIWKYHTINDCKLIYKDVAATVHSGDESRYGLSSKEKLIDYLFYIRFISDTVEGLEAGKMPMSNESLHPISEVNWHQWSRCMSSGD